MQTNLSLTTFDIVLHVRLQIDICTFFLYYFYIKFLIRLKVSLQTNKNPLLSVEIRVEVVDQHKSFEGHPMELLLYIPTFNFFSFFNFIFTFHNPSYSNMISYSCLPP